MTAGLKTLEILDRPGAYEHLEKVTGRLIEGILQAGRDAGHAVTGGHISGGRLCILQSTCCVLGVQHAESYKAWLAHALYFATVLSSSPGRFYFVRKHTANTCELTAELHYDMLYHAWHCMAKCTFL